MKRASRLLGSFAMMAFIWSINFLARKPVTSDRGDITVVLTTYGARMRFVHLAIESIARGSERPSRLVLTLADEEFYAKRSRGLQRLIRRGLEIALVEDLGPHKKYYPIVSAKGPLPPRLATADDDVLYPRNWLLGLDRASLLSPASVVAYRVHRMRLTGAQIAAYSLWLPCRTDKPSLLNVATGVSGILYPQEMLASLRKRGQRFMDVAPRADDIWLHSVAVDEGIPIRQVSARASDFVGLPRAGKVSLFKYNVLEGGNDTQIRATYSSDALQRLLSADAEERERDAQ